MQNPPFVTLCRIFLQPGPYADPLLITALIYGAGGYMGAWIYGGLNIQFTGTVEALLFAALFSNQLLLSLTTLTKSCLNPQ